MEGESSSAVPAGERDWSRGYCRFRGDGSGGACRVGFEQPGITSALKSDGALASGVGHAVPNVGQRVVGIGGVPSGERGVMDSGASRVIVSVGSAAEWGDEYQREQNAVHDFLR